MRIVQETSKLKTENWQKCPRRVDCPRLMRRMGPFPTSLAEMWIPRCPSRRAKTMTPRLNDCTNMNQRSGSGMNQWPLIWANVILALSRSSRTEVRDPGKAITRPITNLIRPFIINMVKRRKVQETSVNWTLRWDKAPASLEHRKANRSRSNWVA